MELRRGTRRTWGPMSSNWSRSKLSANPCETEVFHLCSFSAISSRNQRTHTSATPIKDIATASVPHQHCHVSKSGELGLRWLHHHLPFVCRSRHCCLWEVFSHWLPSLGGCKLDMWGVCLRMMQFVYGYVPGAWLGLNFGNCRGFRRVFQFSLGPVNFETIFRLSPATIGLPNRYNLILHFPIFILIYYGSNLVKKRLSYEALKIAQTSGQEL
ncbi:unnamed protein product [Malus baccata var. baccata]